MVSNLIVIYTRYLQIVMMLRFSILFVWFHINLIDFFVLFHSSVIIKPTRSRSVKMKSLSELLHEPSEMVLGRTDALNEKKVEKKTD